MSVLWLCKLWLVGGRLKARVRKALDKSPSKPNFPLGLGANQDIVRDIQDLATRLRDDLKVHTVLLVSANLAELYSPSAAPFGADVDRAFPSASEEILEAGRCIAVARTTASVFHSMRVLEAGLKALAVHVGAATPNPNWEQVIGAIESAAKKINATTHGATWKDERQFSAEAAAHLRDLKNAWRNHAMHLKDRYDEPRATAIYHNVRSFMQHLATRVAE
jgi:hypothetical protein